MGFILKIIIILYERKFFKFYEHYKKSIFLVGFGSNANLFYMLIYAELFKMIKIISNKIISKKKKT